MAPKTLEFNEMPDEAFPFEVVGRNLADEEVWRLRVEQAGEITVPAADTETIEVDFLQQDKVLQVWP